MISYNFKINKSKIKIIIKNIIINLFNFIIIKTKNNKKINRHSSRKNRIKNLKSQNA